MLTEQNIDIYRGEHVTLSFTMSPVVDISGWAITFSLAKKRNSATKIVTQAATIISGPAGTFYTTLTEEQTDLAPGAHVWDVWRTDEGYEQILALGPITLAAAVRTPATP